MDQYKLYKLFSILFVIIFINVRQVSSRSGRHVRVVGGNIAELFSIPYQASLQWNGTHVCGGVIIKENVILTAGHCAGGSINYYSVRIGTNILQKGGEVIRVSHKVIHPKYNRDEYIYDIAIMLLNRTLIFNEQIQAIPLPQSNELVMVGINATISGWGYLQEESDKPSKDLRFGIVPIVEASICEKYLYYFHRSYEREICAGYTHGDVDACTLDSGGPLVIDGKLFGIISTGMGCARENEYGIYTRVGYYRKWIDEVILENSRGNNI